MSKTNSLQTLTKLIKTIGDLKKKLGKQTRSIGLMRDDAITVKIEVDTNASKKSTDITVQTNIKNKSGFPKKLTIESKMNGHSVSAIMGNSIYHRVSENNSKTLYTLKCTFDMCEILKAYEITLQQLIELQKEISTLFAFQDQRDFQRKMRTYVY